MSLHELINPLVPTIDQLISQQYSIQEALDSPDADGTRSILDMDYVSDEPDFCVAAPLPPEELERLFGTQHGSLQAR